MKPVQKEGKRAITACPVEGTSSCEESCLRGLALRRRGQRNGGMSPLIGG